MGIETAIGWTKSTFNPWIGCQKVGPGCDNCGGEGFYYDCFEEWACVDPESGCDLCRRRCDWCNPRPRNKALDDVLAEALANTTTGE